MPIFTKDVARQFAARIGSGAEHKPERMVTIPESTAVLIRKVFLPANPNKLRERAGLQGDRLEQVRKACHDFIGAIDGASEPKEG